MRGVELIELAGDADQVGRLTVLAPGRFPFDPRNLFFISDVPRDAVRGEHSSSSDEVLIATKGNLSVDLDNGQERTTIYLNRPDQALCIGAGVYLRLRGFAPGAVLMVLASKEYSASSRFDGPQPELLDMHTTKAPP